MAKISNSAKREYARTLYLAGETVAKVLAAKVGVTEKTMGRWIKQENWEQYRLNIPVVQQEQLQKLMRELEQLNEHIANKPEGQRFADTKEADIRRKLVADIEALKDDASVADTISVSMSFTRWLSRIDVKKAQEVSTYLDAFIKEKLG